MIQSILYGNGVNLLTKGMPSWDQLINEIADVALNAHIPNTLKYEALLMKKPYREPPQKLITQDGCTLMDNEKRELCVAGELTEKKLKKKIAMRLGNFSSNLIYDSIAKLPVSHIMTTNYDNTLFTSVGERTLNRRFREEKIYSIRRNYELNASDGSKKYYWPIHGNIDSPASIMLGFDHYCGSLAKIEQYIKGGYDLHGDRLESITKRLQQGIPEVVSWVDLFFISDVHIIGLNLGYEETDLWWVINKRRRIKQANPDLVNNRIIYYPVAKLDAGIRQLFTSFDVDIVPLDDKLNKNRYFLRYRSQINAMEQNMRRFGLPMCESHVNSVEGL